MQPLEPPPLQPRSTFGEQHVGHLILPRFPGFVQHLFESARDVPRTDPPGAIYQLEKGGLRTILSKAIWAAYKKSRLLGERAQQPLEGPLKISDEGN